jgi:carboxymethylenebutenolidase
MIDQQVEIPTKDGHTTTFISHPERGGPFPVILFYMDAPAIREELRDMARRLATSGYYVMLPNLYYRSGVMELGPIPPDPDAPERKRMFGYMNSIDIPKVMEDTRAAHLCRRPGRGEHEDRRHRRLLHERPLCGQCGDAFP